MHRSTAPSAVSMPALAGVTNPRAVRVLAAITKARNAGATLDDAIHTVQRIEHAAALGEDLAYGPSVNVRRVYELHVARVAAEAPLDRRALLDAPDQLLECAQVIDALVERFGAGLQHKERVHADITAGIARNTAKAAQRAVEAGLV